MGLDPYIHIQVALGAVSYCFPVFTKSDSCAVIYSGRYLQADILIFPLRTAASTDGTHFFWNFSTAFACRTSRRLLYISEYGSGNRDHLAAAFTIVTRLQLMARFNSSTFAVFTSIFQVEI